MQILIVDDEPLARKRLANLLQNEALAEFAIEVVAEAGNGEDGLALALKHKPDVILLDIRMPGLDGLQVARHLSAMGEAPSIIFTTAYDEHAMAAFDAQAVGYLLKPIRVERLAESLSRAARLSPKQVTDLVASDPAGNENTQRDRFCFNKRGQLTIIPLDSIRYFRADQKYVTLCYYQKNQWHEEIIDDTLKDLEAEFPTSFLRVHRNTLVAKKFVEKLTRDSDGHYHVHIQDLEEAIAVSRRQVKEVKNLLTT
ncbi:MAG: response regulator transcription factor [Gammaproteobacteria bacterium]|nr:LytTR family DNA-binding domain-containing protein [Gammaproteobacteria bacterium]NNC96784.1 response regulator transcription factor [Gammaproteobacteria bacterium]NNM14959.1 response regulator transcription factor [Gammaproteobacteria bacterium]